MHSRRRPTVMVPITKLVVSEDIKISDRLVQLYLKLNEGRINCALTRLPTDQLVPGYYERQSGKNILVSNLNREYIPIVQHAIRGGNRPVLDVFWSPLAPNGGAYVCADDEVTLAAYLGLNIKWVPSRILKPKKVNALEAAIWVEKRGRYIGLMRSVAPTVNAYASLVGEVLPPFSDLICLLREACRSTCDAIEAFHNDDTSGVHYHQMLHALVRRHSRVLDSILRLVELGREEHAEVLTRSVYESFLNFYIDWLSPEFFGPRLQLLSTVRAARNMPDDALVALDNFVDFFENTGEKARVSPLGSYFHSAVYPPLSLVAHQSYVHLENEVSSFSNAEAQIREVRMKQLGQWLDILTTALLVRIQHDIGIVHG